VQHRVAISPTPATTSPAVDEDAADRRHDEMQAAIAAVAAATQSWSGCWSKEREDSAARPITCRAAEALARRCADAVDPVPLRSFRPPRTREDVSGFTTW